MLQSKSVANVLAVIIGMSIVSFNEDICDKLNNVKMLIYKTCTNTSIEFIDEFVFQLIVSAASQPIFFT